MHEIEIEVTEEFNLYKKLIEKFGKEKNETPIPSLHGTSSLREWDNGIYLVRKVKYDFGRKMHVMKDRVSIPDRPELKGLIKYLGGNRKR